MKLWKRTISVFLVFSMVLTMLPVFALAEETEQPAQEETLTQEQPSQEETVTDEQPTQEEVTETEDEQEITANQNSESVTEEKTEIESETEISALTEEAEASEKEESVTYPWDNMTDEEFVRWLMAEENRAYIVSLFDENNAGIYEALLERIEQIADDDTYSKVCDYLMMLYEAGEAWAGESKEFEMTVQSEGDAYEYALFPMVNMNISQGVNGSYSHQGLNALDICGKDKGIEDAYAPFTGTIKRIYKDYVVWLESNNPVIYADGTVDYMTILFMHDNDTSDLYVGKVISQGEVFFQEGTAGNATGNHIHIECGRGKFSGTGWYENSYGHWQVNNSILPYNALFLNDSISVINSCDYSWKKTNGTVIPSNPSTNNFEIDTRFSGFLPIELCYTADANTAKIPLYNGNLEQYSLSQRNILNTDDCKILEIYTNGFCKVNYPSGSTRREEYAKLSDFIPNINVTAWTADAKYNTYRRSTGYDAVILNSGTSYVDPGDNCLAVGYKDGRTQIIYPSGTGKKMGWIESAYPATTKKVSIWHWMSGLQYNEGTNGENNQGNCHRLSRNEYDVQVNSQFVLGWSYEKSGINGVYLDHISSRSFSSEWEAYPVGTEFTMKNENVGVEYDYNPYNYAITYNLDGGTNAASNPNSYTVCYGVTLENPTKSGWTFVGWKDQNGNMITGINQGKNMEFVRGQEDCYEAIKSEFATRRTGDITLTAVWQEDGQNSESQPSGNVEYSTSTDYAGMKSRADAILNYTWTPTQRIATWNGNKYNGRTYFEAGETVSGMPYTLFTSEVTSDSLLSLAQYARKAQSNYSTTAYCNSTSANRTGPVYGSCCATFVSEVFGGNFMYGENPRYDSVRGIINSPHGTTRYNVPLRDVQPGDALSNTEQHHIIWVSEVTDSTITFYEQTPPIVQKQTISKSSVDGNGYLIYNGATYNIQTKNYVEDTLPTPPTPLPAWSLMQGKPIVAMAPSKISIASNQYISAYDLCIIRDFNAENGQCTVVYPSGGNNVFSSTQRTVTMNLTNMVAYNADFATQHLTATKSYDVYPLSDMDAHGHTWALDPGDEFYTINRVGNATEVLYYCSRGAHAGYWKLGWIYLDYCYLDLNCVVDGTAYGTISECGTVDMILNGESYGKNITDFYMEVPYGSTYRFENLRCTDATYKGVKEGSLEGQVTGKTDVVLEFTRNNPCEISTSVQKNMLTVSWNYVPWATVYNVRIFKDTNYTGTEYSQWGVTDNSCKVQLPLGHYYVYVDSCTTSVAKQSNIVELDITECEVPITITPTIPGAAQAGISVTAPEGGWKEGTNTFTVACAKPCVVAVSYDGGQTYVRLTASDAAGGKSFTAENMTADTQLVVQLSGDTNGDGKINVVDANLIRRHAAQIALLNDTQKLAADVNGDGKVNVVDANLIRRYAAKIIDFFNTAG